MCPRSQRSSTQEIPDSPSRVPHAAWIASARCSTATFRRHLTTRSILCDDCFSSLAPRRHYLYERVIRHFVTLGDDSEYERCSSCSRILVATTPVREATCGECPRILSGFLAYIVRHSLTPYNDPGPTIIVIREFRA